MISTLTPTSGDIAPRRTGEWTERERAARASAYTRSWAPLYRELDALESTLDRRTSSSARLLQRARVALDNAAQADPFALDGPGIVAHQLMREAASYARCAETRATIVHSLLWLRAIARRTIKRARYASIGSRPVAAPRTMISTAVLDGPVSALAPPRRAERVGSAVVT